jgi:hypothetical protein
MVAFANVFVIPLLLATITEHVMIMETAGATADIVDLFAIWSHQILHLPLHHQLLRQYLGLIQRSP